MLSNTELCYTMPSDTIFNAEQCSLMLSEQREQMTHIGVKDKGRVDSQTGS